jgi:hypothetical protein
MQAKKKGNNWLASPAVVFYLSKVTCAVGAPLRYQQLTVWVVSKNKNRWLVPALLISSVARRLEIKI